jgi:hypothetical protein
MEAYKFSRRDMNTQYWYDKFSRWAESQSQTERDKADRSERMIRDAIRSCAPLATRNVYSFAQGSYRNCTNVRAYALRGFGPSSYSLVA